MKIGPIKLIATVIFVLHLTAIVYAQAKPDLSGTWVLDQSRSEMANALELTSTIYVIVHQEPEIRIVSKTDLGGLEMVKESTYFSDGRGETNRPQQRDVQSVTKWSGKKLVIKYEIPTGSKRSAGGVRKVEVKMTETWELSKDGSKLTKTISTRVRTNDPPSDYNVGGGPQYRDVKLVYTRI